MKNFIIKIFKFIFSIIIFILIFIIITNKKIDNSPIFSVSKDVKYLILGHSHSQYAFNDSLIKHSKNFSQAGELFFYTYIKVKKIISDNKQIKTIFLEFSNNEIALEMEKWTRSEQDILYRIPKYAPVMQLEDFKYIVFKNPRAFLKTIPLVFKNNLNFLVLRKKNYIVAQDWGGYFVHKNSFVNSILLNRKKMVFKNDTIQKFSSINLKYLFKIIDYCNKKDINLYLIRSPQHKEYPILQNEQLFQSVLKSKFKNVNFLDFNNFPISNNEYVDLQHLNSRGARKLSLFFNNLLKNGLLDKKDKQQFINKEMQKLSN